MPPRLPRQREAFCWLTTMKMLAAYAAHDRHAWDATWQGVHDDLARRLIAFNLWNLLVHGPAPERRRQRFAAHHRTRHGHEAADKPAMDMARADTIILIAALDYVFHGGPRDIWRVTWPAVRGRPDVIWELTGLAYDAW